MAYITDWKHWKTKIALTITNQVDLIKPEDLIQQLSEKSVPIFVFHVIMIKSYPSQVHISQMAQIWAATPKTVPLPQEYKHLEDVFSTENAGHLPLHEDHNRYWSYWWQTISLRAYLPLIWSELSILQTYIDNNLANKIIRRTKSSVLCLCSTCTEAKQKPSAIKALQLPQSSDLQKPVSSSFSRRISR